MLIVIEDEFKYAIQYLGENQWIFALLTLMMVLSIVFSFAGMIRQKKHENAIQNRFSENRERNHKHYIFDTKIFLLIMVLFLWWCSNIVR